MFGGVFGVFEGLRVFEGVWGRFWGFRVFRGSLRV